METVVDSKRVWSGTATAYDIQAMNVTEAREAFIELLRTQPEALSLHMTRQ